MQLRDNHGDIHSRFKNPGYLSHAKPIKPEPITEEDKKGIGENIDQFLKESEK
jgi:hypothetical protein